MNLSYLKHLKCEYENSRISGSQQTFSAYLLEHGLSLGNLYQEVEMTSRYVDTHLSEGGFNAGIPLHSHTFYEVLYSINTCGMEYLVGTDRYRLQKGDIIFVPPGYSHRPLFPAQMTEPYKRYVLWLSAEFLETLSRSFPSPVFHRQNIPHLLRTSGIQQDILRTHFHNGVQEAERKAPGWESVVIGNTMILLPLLKRAILNESASPLQAEKPMLLDLVIAYVETHLDDRISLEDIARHFFVSQSTVSQTFRKKMGVSFYKYVTQRRLIVAKSLILQGLSLETVGEQVGFSDYSTFYRAFRQEYGISPRQFRMLQENIMSQ